MTRSLVPLPQVAALSVVIALLASPVAAAQSADLVPTGGTSAKASLLSPTAFARLIQPRPQGRGQTPAGPESQRPGLLRSATAAAASAAGGTPKAAPPRRQGWSPKNPYLWLLLGALGFGAWIYACSKSDCRENSPSIG